MTERKKVYSREVMWVDLKNHGEILVERRSYSSGDPHQLQCKRDKRACHRDCHEFEWYPKHDIREKPGFCCRIAAFRGKIGGTEL